MSSTGSATRSACPAPSPALEYDPNRTARIALIHYADGAKSYILAPDGLSVGDQVLASKNADVKPGNCMRLRDLPLGTVIHNIELKIGKGRAARALGRHRGSVDGEGRQLRPGAPPLR